MKLSRNGSFFLALALVYSNSISTLSDALDCGSPGRPRHGHVNVTIYNAVHFPPGTAASYNCSDVDFVLKGCDIRICQENGKWSGYRPRCEKNVAYGKRTLFVDGQTEREEPSVTDGNTGPSDDQNCPSLNPGNSSMLRIELTNNYTIKIIEIHFQDEPDGTGRVFVDDQECRKLNHTNERTLTFDCFSPSNGHHSGGSIQFNHLSSIPLRICEIEASKATGLECGNPEVPAHCNIVFTKRGSSKIVEYKCKDGYQLIGHANRTCFGNRWQGEPPVCKATADQPSTLNTTTPKELTRSIVENDDANILNPTTDSTDVQSPVTADAASTKIVESTTHTPVIPSSSSTEDPVESTVDQTTTAETAKDASALFIAIAVISGLATVILVVVLAMAAVIGYRFRRYRYQKFQSNPSENVYETISNPR